MIEMSFFIERYANVNRDKIIKDVLTEWYEDQKREEAGTFTLYKGE